MGCQGLAQTAYCGFDSKIHFGSVSNMFMAAVDGFKITVLRAIVAGLNVRGQNEPSLLLLVG